jgi:glycopeptide antibiotics resistance protein
MITDSLLDHSAFVPGALALVGLVCAAVGYAALRSGRYGSRVLGALAAVSLVAVLALTLVPTGRTSSRGCTVQFAWPALGSVELLANVALFLPLALFAALATRRPAAVAVGGSALSVAIEVVQSQVTAIGRACDTNDWAMNSLGVLIGALAAGALLAITARAAVAR